MSDISNPQHIISDVDVVGPGATLNDDSMDIDKDISFGRSIQCSSQFSTQDVGSSAKALSHVLSSIEYANKAMLLDLVKLHGIRHPSKYSIDMLRDLLFSHLSYGECADSASVACTQLAASFCVRNDLYPFTTKVNLQLQILSSILYLVRQRPLRRILSCLNVTAESDLSLSKLRSELKKFITKLKRGKQKEYAHNSILEQEKKLELKKKENSENWPQLVPDCLKEKIIKLFHEKTSSEVLATFTCASCSSLACKLEQKLVSLSDIDMDLLKPSRKIVSSKMPMPCEHESLFMNWMIDPEGIKQDEEGHMQLQLCKTCYNSLRKRKTPPLSLANGTYLGPIPSELSDLTPVEEAMIARCRAKCWIIQLKEDSPTIVMPETQQGVHGHIIIYPQRPSEIAKVLPPSINDLLTPICVLFVGANTPSLEWLREKAKPLCIRREKVRNALKWLKENNHLYADIEINNDVLNSLDDNHILPFHIEHILPSNQFETLVSRYDDDTDFNSISVKPELDEHLNDIPFQNVVITNVDGHAPSHELRAAALRHVKQGGGYIQIPHEPTPVNEFCNPSLFPMIYPTLFPYGIGGFEDKTQKNPISMKRHVKHLCSLSDRRFQEHYSFMFTAFNILQRRAVLLHTSLKARKANFNSIASDFASVSPPRNHAYCD